MPKPNLFSYATSELSQDAAICWLLAWAQPEAREQDPHLYELAISLIQKCFEMHGQIAPVQIDSIKVRRQFEKIDILAVINQETVLLIEDKVFSKEHSGQLARYRLALGSGKEYAGMPLLLIYLQTGEQSSYKDVEKEEYAVLRRAELIQLLKCPIAQGCKNEILADFHNHLVGIEEDVQSYRTAPLAGWSGRAWQGFFGALQKEGVTGDWGYVPNPSRGFWGFWWGGQDGSPAYLQLEEGLLCFKISISDAAARSNAKYSWSERMVRAGQEMGLKVVKPGRLRGGGTMTVAVLKDYRIPAADGTLDLRRTVGLLGQAEKVLVNATAQDA